jgi:hypothetical protein
MSYLNDFSMAVSSRRKLLLGWVFSTIKRQDGHALAIASRGLEMFGDAIFAECERGSIAELRKRYPSLAMHVLKRGLSKALGR